MSKKLLEWDSMQLGRGERWARPRGQAYRESAGAERSRYGCITGRLQLAGDAWSLAFGSPCLEAIGHGVGLCCGGPVPGACVKCLLVSNTLGQLNWDMCAFQCQVVLGLLP